jgi:hypothetical protein
MPEYAIVPSNTFEENSPSKNRDTPLSYLKRSQHEIFGEAKGGFVIIQSTALISKGNVRKSRTSPNP